MKYFLSILIIMLLLASQDGVAFFTGTGGMPGEFLYTGSSARGYAMGRSVAAYADDSSAMYYNPACMVLDGDMEFSMLNMTPLENMGTAEHFGLQHNFLSAKLPLGVAGTVGAGVVLHQISGIELWSENFDMLGSPREHSMRDMAFMGSYAKRLFLFPYRLSAVGATAELIWQSHTLPDSLGLQKNSFAFGLDLGLLQQINSAFYVGLNVKHALPPVLTLGVAETFPTIFKWGLAYKPGFEGEQAGPFGVFENLLFTTGVDTALHFSSAHENGWALFPSFHLGAEKRIMIKPGEYELSLRVGLNDLGVLLDGSGMEMEFAYGFGLRLFEMIKIDVAADTSPMGILNRVVASISLRFDTHSARSEEYLRLAEKSTSSDYGKALKQYRMAHEVNPKNPEIYERIKNAQEGIRRHRIQVRSLCEKGNFEAAYDFIREKKDKSYYEELEREYVNRALKDLAELQKTEGREAFEELAQLNLRHFPENSVLKKGLEKLTRRYWKPDVETVRKMCEAGRFEKAHEYIKDREGKSYYNKLVNTYGEIALVELKSLQAEERGADFFVRARYHEEHFPNNRKMKEGLSRLRIIQTQKEAGYVEYLCDETRFKEAVRYIKKRKGKKRYKALADSYVTRVIPHLEYYVWSNEPKKFENLAEFSLRNFPKHKRLKNKVQELRRGAGWEK